MLSAASVTAGVVLPASALSGLVGTGPLIVCASVVMGLAICCASAGSPVFRGFGSVLGGVLALVLVPFNGTVPLWEGLVILAVMFLGTAAYRAEHGQSTWRCTAGAAGLVVVCAVGSVYWSGTDTPFARRGWITGFLLAALTFALGLASRGRRVPQVLTALGTISYSVYLVHPVLLAVIDGTIGRRRQDSLVLEVAFVGALLPLCLLTHRCVEAPSQAWGRRLAARLQPPGTGR
ncbi:acyltransferase family protein [Streptomyces canus]|uniref:acyltransferase family protein n=1 Tax=Streptomyces canus TaxID=58343 RepID=UPI002DDB5592|nr:acyltransferase family protein [Streptomyces canus]